MFNLVIKTHKSNQELPSSGLSYRGIYGLMSRTGVPSTISVPMKCTQAPSIDEISTKDRPIAQGRCGERVLNTPTRFPFNLGGATFDLPVFASFRWKK